MRLALGFRSMGFLAENEQSRNLFGGRDWADLPPSQFPRTWLCWLLNMKTYSGTSPLYFHILCSHGTLIPTSTSQAFLFLGCEKVNISKGLGLASAMPIVIMGTVTAQLPVLIHSTMRYRGCLHMSCQGTSCLLRYMGITF